MGYGPCGRKCWTRLNDFHLQMKLTGVYGDLSDLLNATLV